MIFGKKSVSYIIVGLGNPGREYENTRHNAGFHSIDRVAQKLNVKIDRLKFNALYGIGDIDGKKVMLLKPQTFMNLSGEAVRDAAKFYKVLPQNVIVLSDDASLSEGTVRVRASGTDGGQKGLRNIILHLGTNEIPRVKIGVGTPDREEMDMADWVLKRLTAQELNLMDKTAERAALAAIEIVKNGATRAASTYNGTVKE